MSKGNELDDDQTGNFLIRLGYFSGCLFDARYHEWLIEQGVTETEIDAARDAVVALANCFYQGRKR